MFFTSFRYESTDGMPIFTYSWRPDERSEQARGVVQIAHGMAEHALRYQELAAELVEDGFIIYANDHRGHGKTAGSPEQLGFLAVRNGWQLLVEDFYHLTRQITENHPGLPVILLGHSMGSFLVRSYIGRYGHQIQGVILSGTAGSPGLKGRLGRYLALLIRLIKGGKTRSPLLNKLSFGSYNQAFQSNRTAFDWLSRDQREVDRYNDDPYCGAVSTSGFFCDLLAGLEEINQNAHFKQTPEDLPIYLISGEQDPVGDNTRGVLEVYRAYQQAGIRDLSYKFYPGARHEILHELNRQEVINDIKYWLISHCNH